jgi:hypothetical protein
MRSMHEKKTKAENLVQFAFNTTSCLKTPYRGPKYSNISGAFEIGNVIRNNE